MRNKTSNSKKNLSRKVFPFSLDTRYSPRAVEFEGFATQLDDNYVRVSTQVSTK